LGQGQGGGDAEEEAQMGLNVRGYKRKPARFLDLLGVTVVDRGLWGLQVKDSFSKGKQKKKREGGFSLYFFYEQASLREAG